MGCATMRERLSVRVSELLIVFAVHELAAVVACSKPPDTG